LNQAARPGRSSLVLICCIAAFCIGSIGIYVPSMPHIAEEFAVPLGTVQFSLTTFLVGNALAQPFAGALSDRYGRRRIMLAGMLVWLAGNVGAALAPGAEALIAARFVQAMGTAVGLAVSRAMVGDMFDRANGSRAMSYVVLANAIGPLLSPTVGGLIDVTLGWRYGFGLLAVASAAMFVLTLRLLPETVKPQANPGPVLRTMFASQGALLRQPGFWGFALVNLGLFGSYFMFNTAGPAIFVRGMGVSAPGFGLMIMALTASFIFGSFLSGRFGMRVGIEGMIDRGTALSALAGLLSLGLVLLLPHSTPLTMLLPMLVFSVGQGLCQANALTGATKIDVRRAGAAAGLIGSLQIFGGTLGTLTVIAIPADTPLSFAVPFCAALLLTLTGWRLLRRHAAATGKT
jgi:DHA1 family bicyclomycin/chloramphenicol resistance-like MFS transporter